MPKGDRLTDKERRFIAAYVGECRGNGIQAALAAGYRGNPNTLAVRASQLLRKANVAAAVEALQVKRENQAILTADELDIICSEIVKNPLAFDRMRAIDILNKVKGRYITRLADAEGKPLSFIVQTGVPERS